MIKKFLKKKLAGRLEDFNKLDCPENIPSNYIENDMRDALDSLAIDAVKEYIYKHDDESDQIAKAVLGENYSMHFNGSIDRFVDEISMLVITKCEQVYSDCPREIQDIISNYLDLLSQIED